MRIWTIAIAPYGLYIEMCAEACITVRVGAKICIGI